MAGLHWFFQLIIIAFVAAIDLSQKEATIGFWIALFYMFAALYSLIRKDFRMFRRRGFLFVAFLVEVFAVGSVVQSPPDLGFLDRWVHKLAK